VSYVAGPPGDQPPSRPETVTLRMDIAPRGRLESLHREAHAWALACCGYRPDEALDVVQTAYLKILDGSARYDGRSSYKTWLFAIIRNTAADRRRRIRRAVEALARFGRGAPEPFADPGAEQTEQRRAILRAVMHLPARQRQIVELVFYHDLTLEAAAEVIGIGVGTARTHYDRAKKALARLLEGVDV
jgi:RNA polymerase sigma factor (sigma-70 family)